MISSAMVVVLAIAGLFGWNLIARGGYESAEYKVVESDCQFEVRNYPDLILAVTKTKLEVQGRDGRFMKLFRHIRESNESKKKIAMTTRVFTENQDAGSHVQMNTVLPKVTVALNAIVLVFASTHLCYSDSVVSETQQGWNAAAIGRKTVTVDAENEASTSAQATKQNPGWTVESVKKESKDPKSRAFQITLTK